MISIVVAGDYCPRARVAELIENERYSEIFGEIKPLLGLADYSLVNLECPILISSGEPIAKCGPNLKSTPNAISAIKYAGFDMVTLANNHFYDFGENGVKDTLETCKAFKIDVVGGGQNLVEASQVNFKEIKGKRFAFINCCENEFSIATDQTGGSNPLNPISIYYQIKDAQYQADYVIVITHGGHEHYQLPSPRMKETYRFFVEAGADVIINHHQHCYSGYEIYKGKLIAYGIGNFCFDKNGIRDSKWNEGYLVELQFEDHCTSFKLHPYIQANERSGIFFMTEKEKKHFKREIQRLNEIILDNTLIEENHNDFVLKDTKSVLSLFEPYSNRYLHGLFRRSLLPSFLNKKKLLQIINTFFCEAHRDRTFKILKTKYQQL